MSVSDALRRVSLFADLRDDELATLADGLSRRVFAKDVILFHKGSPAQSLYLIESGEVRIFALSETGHEITLDVYGPGECFGETALLDGNLRSTGAMALEKTVTYTLGRDGLLRCLELHPQVARRLLALLAHRLEHATAYAENLAFLDVAGRVAAVLLELAARHGAEHGSVDIELQLTQSELASWVCASREMVNKVLAAYREQKLILMEGHTITILDFGGLKRKIAY
jgi:CRP/FNR family transcriptional regulator/CRP/FNR family cyclic AMP-dependent transcriptional regulator